MLKGKRNQLANVGNRFQGKAKKVLAVCSAGLLRSPTLANVLHRQYGFNTRAVGSCDEYALIPISQALIWWADEIVFVNQENFDELSDEEKAEIQEVAVPVTILSITDDFDWDDPELQALLIQEYDKAWDK
ncbi:MAG: hypothetical protein Tp178MES00d2C33159851_7 [Prokaryotic dsDNA virus sp.]|nr:MAG: hypothetical protein Tp178MES00d2C33159851_7 [Prokaryotic dsDNA virus sp.]|tara:strand:- start:89633 stop:90025 length:393 start_codon:yes stop_codon:yes gene_type:complete